MSIKQCLVAAAVHFTVKHTKTEKVYRANTFVTNIYIKNKIPRTHVAQLVAVSFCN